MPTTLTDVLADRTQEQEEQILLSVFQSEAFPVTDWNVGGVARTMAKAIAAAMLDKYKLVQTIAKGELVLLAKDLKDTSGKEVQAWLDLLGVNFYDLARSPATFTIQRVQFSCAAGFGPLTISQGFTARALPSGNRYVYQGASPVTVPDGGAVNIDLTAEEAGAKYDDPAGTLVEQVTPLPGLTINNPATTFGGLDTAGRARKSATSQGHGTVTPSAPTTAPVLARSYTIRVTASGTPGASGTVALEYAENGQLVQVGTVSPIPATYTGLGDGITLTFAPTTGIPFIIGDAFTFGTPGTPIIQQGVDIETNEQYAERLLGRWPSLSPHPVVDKYETMVRQASLDAGYGIEKVTVRPSATEAGVANIVVATASGAPPNDTITALQTYINLRTGITDKVVILAAANENITIAGTVTVAADDYTDTRAAADEAWRKYITSLKIGGDTSTGTPGVVRISELVQVLMDAGAIDYSGIQIGGAAVNYQLAETEVAVIPAGQLPSEALTWVTVG